jgi:hypothetical protein
MLAAEAFERMLTGAEREILSGLRNPAMIQAFLDGIIYSTDDFYRCPLRVLRERVAHCFDGAIFAAAALRRIGYPPLVLDMLANGRDDEQLPCSKRMVAGGCTIHLCRLAFHERSTAACGAGDVRLEQYYNLEREKTLRGYTGPLNLRSFDRLSWMTQDEPLERIANAPKIRRVEPFPTAMAMALSGG